MQNPNLFVITGGPGAGKTTVLLELEKHGFSHAPEVARQIIQEQVRNHGTALPWVDRKLYIELMLSRSIDSYKAHTPAPQPIFSDRGIHDTLAYARLIGMADEQEIRQACERYRYATRVFVAPPWKEIYETDSERKQDFPEAERTYQTLVSTYRDCGYATIELPKSSPKERAAFILNQLQLA